MQPESTQPRKIPVIVRGWADEPVKLYLHRIENNRCYVGSEGAVRPIGIPPEQVFLFDENTFSTLCSQFNAQNRVQLGEEWANIRMDDFVCNRYQDMLKCSHDQEHLTHTERTPSSDSR